MNLIRWQKRVIWILFFSLIFLAPIAKFYFSNRQLFPYYDWGLWFESIKKEVGVHRVYITSYDDQPLAAPIRLTELSDQYGLSWKKTTDYKLVDRMARHFVRKEMAEFEKCRSFIEAKYIARLPFKKASYVIVWETYDVIKKSPVVREQVVQIDFKK